MRFLLDGLLLNPNSTPFEQIQQHVQEEDNILRPTAPGEEYSAGDREGAHDTGHVRVEGYSFKCGVDTCISSAPAVSSTRCVANAHIFEMHDVWTERSHKYMYSSSEGTLRRTVGS